MTFHLITLFPRAFDSYLGESILKRAIEDKKIKVKFYNPRDYAENKHDRVDRKPYGGGPGMVIQALPVIKAIEAAHSNILKNVRMSKKLKAKSYKLKTSVVWLTPNGKQFTNEYAKKTAQKFSDVIIICGRYEGIDARVKKVLSTKTLSLIRACPPEPAASGAGRRANRRMVLSMDEVSVGPFILTGGELPAMIMIDVISRQVEGVLGDFNSLEESRVSSPDVYTRPEVFEYKKKKYRVPKILLSGHRAKIDEWKRKRQI